MSKETGVSPFACRGGDACIWHTHTQPTCIEPCVKKGPLFSVLCSTVGRLGPRVKALHGEDVDVHVPDNHRNSAPCALFDESSGVNQAGREAISKGAVSTNETH